MFGEISLWFLTSVYIQATQKICEISTTSRRSIRKRHSNLPHILVSFGCSITDVTWCLLFPSSYSSVLVDQCDAQNVFANWRTISDDARVQVHRRVRNNVQKCIFSRGTYVAWILSATFPVDGHAYSKSLLANTVCLSLPPLTRGSLVPPVWVSAGGLRPRYYRIYHHRWSSLIVSHCPNHVPFVK